MKQPRQEFADTMVEVGLADPRLVVMVGDISHGILQPFAKACPGRYFNIGICEPTIVNMAAGLSKAGLIPVVHTIAPFITERAYEQIKLDLGYQKLSANLITVGGAFDYSQLGCSHHCYTDVSILSHLKRARVVVAGSAIEFRELFRQVYAEDGINYFRLCEHPHSVEFDAADIRLGHGIRIREGTYATIVVIGPQLGIVLAAADQLVSRGLGVDVLYFPTVKPFDSGLLRSSLSRTKRLLTVEELSAHDGLLNVCLRASRGLGDLQFDQIAIDDFVSGYGTYGDLCARAGFTVENVIRKVSDLGAN